MVLKPAVENVKKNNKITKPKYSKIKRQTFRAMSVTFYKLGLQSFEAGQLVRRKQEGSRAVVYLRCDCSEVFQLGAFDNLFRLDTKKCTRRGTTCVFFSLQFLCFC